ncbi:integrase family protein [Paracoccus bogoriensis]|uniref:tyrosine-type recombinase/integrase n=1 Tax=Paracoccus bogoriensis TaxID=242065 RepID=UPI001C6811A9|nr:integrase family protein [Paracoccus bogoriensis]
MPERLTEARVKALAYTGKTQYIRDTKATGLILAVNKTSKTYKVQRDLWQGQRGRRRLVKTVRLTLGSTDELTLEDARLRAQEVISQIKRGIDPNAPGSSEAGTWTVQRLFDEYARDMRRRGCVERSIEDVLARLDRYLSDWKGREVSTIRRSDARAMHSRITERHGPQVANMAMRDYRAAYNLALRIVDDPDDLPPNSVAAVTFNKERSSDKVILPEDLPDWWSTAMRIENPIRRAMQRFGLLSGLRPGTLMALELAWIQGEAIVIPRMKSGRSFALPLSGTMKEILGEAIEAGKVLYPRAPYIFPTRDRAGTITSTKVVRERNLETGHILRHTYRTVAQRAGLDPMTARLLLDHTVPGIDGVYLHQRALFDRLLAAQETVTREFFTIIEG